MKYNLEFSNDIYIVNFWKNHKTKKSFYFVGKDAKVTNTSDDHDEIVKEHIFYDDNINTVLNKISNYIGESINETNPNNFFIWAKKKTTNDDIYKFLNILYYSFNIYEVSEFNRFCKMFFDITIDIFDESKEDVAITYDIALEKLLKKQNLYCYVDLLYTFTDTIYSTNPFKHELSDYQTFNKHLAKPLIHNLIYDFPINNSLDNEINLITKAFFDDDDGKCINEYFPNIVTFITKNIMKIYDTTLLHTLKNSFKSALEIPQNDFGSMIQVLEFLTTPYRFINLNLKWIFEMFEMSLNIPLIVYVTQSTNTIKINKDMFYKYTSNEITKLNEKYTKSSGKSNSYIYFEIHTEMNYIIKVNLYANGVVNVSYDLRNHQNTYTLQDLKNNFKLLSFLNTIDTNIYKFKNDTNIFLNTNIKILHYDILNNVTLSKQIKTNVIEKNILSSIDKFSLFYNLKKIEEVYTNKKIIILNYNRNNSYIQNNDPVDNLINLLETEGKKKGEIITILSTKFEMSEEESTNEYNSFKKRNDFINVNNELNILNNLSNTNSTLVKIAILNDRQFRIYSKNVMNNKANNDIIKSCLALILNETIKLSDEDIIKMKHVYEGAHDKHINLYKTFKEKQQKKELDPPPEPLPERELVLSLKKNDHDSSEEQSYDFDSETDDENDENINANTYDMSVETNAELIDYADSLYNTVENDGDGDCGYHSFIGSIKDNHKSLIKITKSVKKLRKQISKYIKKWNKNDIKYFENKLSIDVNDKDDMDNLRKRVGKKLNDGWMESDELHIIAKMFNVCIAVWDTAQKLWMYFYNDIIPVNNIGLGGCKYILFFKCSNSNEFKNSDNLINIHKNEDEYTGYHFEHLNPLTNKLFKGEDNEPNSKSEPEPKSKTEEKRIKNNYYKGDKPIEYSFVKDGTKISTIDLFKESFRCPYNCKIVFGSDNTLVKHVLKYCPFNPGSDNFKKIISTNPDYKYITNNHMSQDDLQVYMNGEKVRINNDKKSKPPEELTSVAKESIYYDLVLTSSSSKKKIAKLLDTKYDNVISRVKGDKSLDYIRVHLQNSSIHVLHTLLKDINEIKEFRRSHTICEDDGKVYNIYTNRCILKTNQIVDTLLHNNDLHESNVKKLLTKQSGGVFDFEEALNELTDDDDDEDKEANEKQNNYYNIDPQNEKDFEILFNNENFEELKNNVSNKKTIADAEQNNQHKEFVLHRLKLYDKNLFEWNIEKDNKTTKNPLYSATCNSNIRRQPIVINQEEKRFIDKNYPKSYSGYVKTGSTVEKKEDNFYICPDVWCPISGISMSKEEFDEKNQKCPNEEDIPINFTSHEKSFFNEKKKDRIIYKDRYPGILDKGKHPKKSQYNKLYDLPCCFKKHNDPHFVMNDKYQPRGKYIEKKLQKESKSLSLTKKKNDTGYVTKLSIKIEDGDKSVLPDGLTWIINDRHCYFNKQSQNKTKSEDGLSTKHLAECFVRLGIQNHHENMLQNFVNLLDNNNITSVAKLIELIISKFVKHPYYYIFHNNGYNLKTYYNDEIELSDPDVFDDFKKWFVNCKEYIEMFKLDKMAAQLDKIKPETIFHSDYYKIIKREFIIYNSLQNYIQYLKSDIVKGIDDVYHLLRYDWFNPKGVNILLINTTDNFSKIICPKYFDLQNIVNFSNPFSFIIQYQMLCYPLCKLQHDKEEICHFEYDNKEEHKKITQLIDTFFYHYKFNDSHLNRSDGLSTLRSLLSNETVFIENVESFVIDYNYKCCGILLKNDIFIPLDKYEEFLINGFINFNDIRSIMYVNDLYSIDPLNKSSRSEIDAIYSSLGLKYLTKNEGIYKLNTDTYKIVVNNHFNNIFIDHNDEDVIGNFSKDFIHVQFEKRQLLYNICLEIERKSNLDKELYYISHHLNPLKLSDKVRLINCKIFENLDIFKDGNSSFSKKELDEFALNLITQTKETIYYKFHKQKLQNKKQKNYLIFEFKEILRNKIQEIHDISKNPYKILDKSIEDYYNFREDVNITLLDVDEIQFTEKYRLTKIHYLEKELKEFSSKTIEFKNSTEGLLDFFSKISIMLNTPRIFKASCFKKLLSRQLKRTLVKILKI